MSSLLHKLATLVLVLVLGMVALAPTPARADDAPAPTTPAAAEPNELERLERATFDVIERARPSVVAVTVRRSLSLDPSLPVYRGAVAMSGVVWSAEGHIVSLGSAFEGADAIEVTLPSGEMRPAELVGIDEDTAVALLKIDPAGLKEPLRVARQGDSGRLRVGSIVVAVGNPFGLLGSASLGNVSGLNRAVAARGRRAFTDAIQITTPVNPGDPGGFLANARGELVGVIASTYERGAFEGDWIASAAYSLAKAGDYLRKLREGGVDTSELERVLKAALKRNEGGGGAEAGGGAGAAGGGGPAGEGEPTYLGSPFVVEGIGFAIPIHAVKPVVERLREEGKVERGWLGVSVLAVDAALKAQLDLAADRGVLVVAVREGSPAERAGLMQHDIVLTFGGTEVSDVREFKRKVMETAAGTVVPVEIARRGQRLGLEIKITPKGK